MNQQTHELRIVSVRPDAETMTKQHLPNYVGISEAETDTRE